MAARLDMPEGLKTELPEVSLVFHLGWEQHHHDPHDSWRVLVERKIDEALIARGSSLRVAGVGLKVGLMAVTVKGAVLKKWVELVVDQRPRERLSRLRAASSAELTIVKEGKARFTGSSLRRVGWGWAGEFAGWLLGGGPMRGPVTVTLDRITPIPDATVPIVKKQVREELLWGADRVLALARERAGRGESVGGWSAQDLPASGEGLLPEIQVVGNLVKRAANQNQNDLPVRVDFARQGDRGASAEAVERFFAGSPSGAQESVTGLAEPARPAGLLGENEDMGEGSSDWWGGPEPGGVPQDGVGQEPAPLPGDAQTVFGSAPVFDEELEGAFWAEFDSGSGFVREDWTQDWVDETAHPVGGQVSDRMEILPDETRRELAWGEAPAPGGEVPGPPQNKGKGRADDSGSAWSRPVPGEETVPPVGGRGWMGNVAVPEDFVWEGVSEATQRLLDGAPGYQRGRDNNPAAATAAAADIPGWLSSSERPGDRSVQPDVPVDRSAFEVRRVLSAEGVGTTHVTLRLDIGPVLGDGEEERAAEWADLVRRVDWLVNRPGLLLSNGDVLVMRLVRVDLSPYEGAPEDAKPLVHHRVVWASQGDMTQTVWRRGAGWTKVHELGHMLGLPNSTVAGTLMGPEVEADEHGVKRGGLRVASWELDVLEQHIGDVPMFSRSTRAGREAENAALVNRYSASVALLGRHLAAAPDGGDAAVRKEDAAVRKEFELLSAELAADQPFRGKTLEWLSARHLHVEALAGKVRADRSARIANVAARARQIALNGQSPVVFHRDGIVGGASSDPDVQLGFEVEAEFETPEMLADDQSVWSDRSGTDIEVTIGEQADQWVEGLLGELRDAGYISARQDGLLDPHGEFDDDEALIAEAHADGKWAAVREASCPYGVELTSAILRPGLDNGVWRQVEEVLRILRDSAGAAGEVVASVQCGGHVNVSHASRPLSAAEKVRLARLNKAFESVLYHLFNHPDGSVQRSMHNAGPNPIPVDPSMADAVHDVGRLLSRDKYDALNFGHPESRSYREFRAPAGALYPEELQAHAELCVLLELAARDPSIDGALDRLMADPLLVGQSTAGLRQLLRLLELLPVSEQAQEQLTQLFMWTRPWEDTGDNDPDRRVTTIGLPFGGVYFRRPGESVRTAMSRVRELPAFKHADGSGVDLVAGRVSREAGGFELAATGVLSDAETYSLLRSRGIPQRAATVVLAAGGAFAGWLHDLLENNMYPVFATQNEWFQLPGAKVMTGHVVQGSAGSLAIEPDWQGWLRYPPVTEPRTVDANGNVVGQPTGLADLAEALALYGYQQIADPFAAQDTALRRQPVTKPLPPGSREPKAQAPASGSSLGDARWELARSERSNPGSVVLGSGQDKDNGRTNDIGVGSSQTVSLGSSTDDEPSFADQSGIGSPSLAGPSAVKRRREEPGAASTDPAAKRAKIVPAASGERLMGAAADPEAGGNESVGDQRPGGLDWWTSEPQGGSGFPRSRIGEDTAHPDLEFERHALLNPHAWDGYLERQEGLRRELAGHAELRFAAGVNRDRLDRGVRGHVRNGFNAVLAAAESVRLGRTVAALPGGPVSVGEAERRLGGELVSAPVEEIRWHLERPDQPVGAQGVVFVDGQWLLAHKARDGQVFFVDAHRGQMADLVTRLGRDGQGNPVLGPSGFVPLRGTGALPLGSRRLDPALRGGADDSTGQPDAATGTAAAGPAGEAVGGAAPGPVLARPAFGGLPVTTGLDRFAEAFGPDLAVGAEYAAGGGAGLGVAQQLLPARGEASRLVRELWEQVEGAVAARAAGEARKQVEKLGLPGSLPGPSLSGALRRFGLSKSEEADADRQVDASRVLDRLRLSSGAAADVLEELGQRHGPGFVAGLRALAGEALRKEIGGSARARALTPRAWEALASAVAARMDVSGAERLARVMARQLVAAAGEGAAISEEDAAAALDGGLLQFDLRFGVRVRNARFWLDRWAVTGQSARVEQLRDKARTMLGPVPEAVPGVGVGWLAQRRLYDDMVEVLAKSLAAAVASVALVASVWLETQAMRSMAEELRTWTRNGPVRAAYREGWWDPTVEDVQTRLELRGAPDRLPQGQPPSYGEALPPVYSERGAAAGPGWLRSSAAATAALDLDPGQGAMWRARARELLRWWPGQVGAGSSASGGGLPAGLADLVAEAGRSGGEAAAVETMAWSAVAAAEAGALSFLPAEVLGWLAGRLREIPAEDALRFRRRALPWVAPGAGSGAGVPGLSRDQLLELGPAHQVYLDALAFIAYDRREREETSLAPFARTRIVDAAAVSGLVPPTAAEHRDSAQRDLDRLFAAAAANAAAPPTGNTGSGGGARPPIPWQYLMVDGKFNLSQVLHQPVRTGAGRQVATVFFAPGDTTRQRREAEEGFEGGIFPSSPYTVAMPRDEETGGFSLWVRTGRDADGERDYWRIALDARGWAHVLLAVKAESPRLGEAANVVALTCSTSDEQLEELRPQLARAGLRALLHAPTSRAAARSDGLQLESGGSMRAMSAEGEITASRVRYPRSAYAGPFEAGPGIVFHGSDVGDNVNSEGGPGASAARPDPVEAVLGLEPEGFDPVQRSAWALLVAGAGSVAELRAGLPGVSERSVREVTAEFVRRVAGLAAVGLAGDAGQGAVLESAMERYTEIGLTDPGADLGGELLFRRWVQGRLPAGDADERVGQALALLGYRPLTPAEREQAVVKIVTVDGKGNLTVEARLEENHQKVLDHLLDHGTATRPDIASVVLGVTGVSATRKVRSSLEGLLAGYSLVGRAAAQTVKNQVLYTALVPPLGGLVYRRTPAKAAAVLDEVLEYLGTDRAGWHTAAAIMSRLKHLDDSSIYTALTNLVRTGAASKQVGDDRQVSYRFVPPESRPEAKKSGYRDVPWTVVAFLEAAENLGKPFTAVQIGQGTGLPDSSVRSAMKTLDGAEPGENKRGAKTVQSSAVGQVRVRPGSIGAKRRAASPENAVSVAKRMRGAAPGAGLQVSGSGVGRSVSGSMDPEVPVSAGRARALAELAGDFALALVNKGSVGSLPVLRVRGYFGSGMKSSDGRAYEESVVAALVRGVRERLAGAGMDMAAVSAVVARVLAGLDMEPVSVGAGDVRAGTFVAWAGGVEPPSAVRPEGEPVRVVSLEDLLGGRVDPAEISVVELYQGDWGYAVGFPAPGPLDERSVLEEAFERRAERGQVSGLWVVEHHGEGGLRAWSKDGTREFVLTPAAAKHLALSVAPAGVLAQRWPVSWVMCRPANGDTRVQALADLFRADGVRFTVPSSRRTQVSRAGVFTGLKPGAQPAPGAIALGDESDDGLPGPVTSPAGEVGSGGLPVRGKRSAGVAGLPVSPRLVKRGLVAGSSVAGPSGVGSAGVGSSGGGGVVVERLDQGRVRTTFPGEGMEMTVHRLRPEPGMDDKFLFCDPDDPDRPYAPYAGPDGKLHPLVRERAGEIRARVAGGRSAVKGIVKADDGRLPNVKDKRIDEWLEAIGRDVAAEVRRTTLGVPAAQARVEVGPLEAKHLREHEGGLEGELGLFLAR
ncbi:hypothetical protein ACFXPA_44020, partial [Amycolatopsis sp. NPDC059090]|uniref:hypothetical protein n=1 Tax=Amycolatopsis sp. NPDC059090 TaxID=3346723 RepID=UPI00366CB140